MSVDTVLRRRVRDKTATWLDLARAGLCSVRRWNGYGNGYGDGYGYGYGYGDGYGNGNGYGNGDG